MDKLHITGLECTALIGVHAWEQHIRQRLVVDLVLAVDAAAAATSDDLRDALDYSEVAQDVREFVSTSRYHLIETLAEALCARLLAGFGIEQVCLRLHKPSAIAAAQDTCIEMQRGG
jgi:dihydroneopterin aldolase